MTDHDRYVAALAQMIDSAVTLAELSEENFDIVWPELGGFIRKGGIILPQ